jgi:hypothetical protein
MAKQAPGVPRHQKVRAVHFLVAAPAQASLIRLAVHPRRVPTELAPLHLLSLSFFSPTFSLSELEIRGVEKAKSKLQCFMEPPSLFDFNYVIFTNWAAHYGVVSSFRRSK